MPWKAGAAARVPGSPGRPPGTVGAAVTKVAVSVTGAISAVGASGTGGTGVEGIRVMRGAGAEGIGVAGIEGAVPRGDLQTRDKRSARKHRLSVTHTLEVTSLTFQAAVLLTLNRHSIFPWPY